MPTQMHSGGPGRMAAKVSLGPHTHGRPRSPENGSGRGLGPKRTFGNPRPTPSRHTQRSHRGALPCLPQGSTFTTCGAPTSSLRYNEWWTRCPYPCGCKAHARGRPPSWCGDVTDRGRGRWRPPPPKVEVYPNQYGDVTQVVIPLTVYETVQGLGYDHLEDLYRNDHQIKGE